ncbi:MAG: TolC family protein, partial [Phycisphaerales bacterium]
MKAGWIIAGCAGAGAVLAGCQGYTARPLDGGGHLAAYMAREAGGAEVAALAARLAEGAPERGTFDVSDGVSAAEGEAVALVFNAELRVARARAGITAAAAETAGLVEDPVLSVDVRRIVESVPRPWMTMGMLGFSVPVSGRLGLEKKLAGAEREADVVRVFASEWATRVEVRRAWVEWSAALEEARVMGEFVAKLEGIVGIVDRLEGAGEMARVEARLFRVERAMRASELRTMELEASRREVELKRVMGLAPSAPVALVAAVGWRAPGGEEGPARRAGVPGEPEAYPPVAVARAEYGAAERELELEVRRQYPDLMIGPALGEEAGMTQVGFGVSLPIPLFNRNRQGIAKAGAARDAARAMYEAEVERAVSEREVARLEHESARVQRESLEREIVPLVDEQDREARRVAELGQVNTMVLLDTLTRQQEAKLRLIRARGAESRAGIRLWELGGPGEHRLDPKPD